MATGYNPPKYFTVKNSILKMLDSGELEANAPLPSERELMLSHDVSRITIRKAIEEIFKVKVLSVNTINVRGKEKRVGVHTGYTAKKKKAIVRLTEDSKGIEIFEGMF